MYVVVLGVDSPIGLSLIRDLGRQQFQVIGIGNAGSVGLSSRYCHVPVLRQQNPALLIKQLLQIAEQYQPIALLTVSESDINLLNQHRTELADCYSLLFPNADIMAIALDKAVTARLAAPLGIACPQSWQLQQLSDLDTIQDELVFPVVLKWANPHDVIADLRAAKLPLEKLEYCHNLLMLQEKLRNYAVIGKYPLIQRYYAGHGLGQFFLCNKGQVLLQFQHERVHEWPPEGGTSTLCRSLSLQQHQACASRSMQLLKTIGWTGVAMVEYRYCPEQQQYVLMEINGRFWGSTPLALASGVGFASGLVRALALQQPVAQPAIKARYCRYMVPEFRRIHRLLFNKTAIKDPYFRYRRFVELGRFLMYFLHPACRYYVFSLDDPKPFFADSLHILKKLVGR